MRQYHTELRETKETIKIICNRCDKDGQTDRFDLCEACYDEWVDGFLIPIERSE